MTRVMSVGVPPAGLPRCTASETLRQCTANRTNGMVRAQRMTNGTPDADDAEADAQT